MSNNPEGLPGNPTDHWARTRGPGFPQNQEYQILHSLQVRVENEERYWDQPPRHIAHGLFMMWNDTITIANMAEDRSRRHRAVTEDLRTLQRWIIEEGNSKLKVVSCSLSS